MSAPQPMSQQQMQQLYQAMLAVSQANQVQNTTQLAALAQQIPQLAQIVQMLKQGGVNETQMAQALNLVRLYNQQGVAQGGPPAQQPPQAGRPQAGPSTSASSQQPVTQQPQPQQPAAPAQPVAGQKRKSPLPDSSGSFSVAVTAPTPSIYTANNTALNSATTSLPLNTTLSVANPGPQTWPNTAGPRPTLSQGLAAGSTMMGTPTHILKVPDTVDALGALNEGYKKDASSAVNDPMMRKTVKDLIASIDPTVKVDKEVEDMLLEMADEFVDSVTNFACRLAKHRGSDTLDVKDLQLHLERNHNIRIPGFSSDETRLAISHSNPATSHQPNKAPKAEASGTAAKKTEGEREKTGKEGKGAKGKMSKSKDVQGSAALRAARIAAIRSQK